MMELTLEQRKYSTLLQQKELFRLAVPHVTSHFLPSYARRSVPAVVSFVVDVMASAKNVKQMGAQIVTLPSSHASYVDA
jgi:hypothetical protein